MQHETLTLQKKPRAKRLYARLWGISNQGMHIVQLAHPEGEVGWSRFQPIRCVDCHPLVSMDHPNKNMARTCGLSQPCLRKPATWQVTTHVIQRTKHEKNIENPGLFLKIIPYPPGPADFPQDLLWHSGGYSGLAVWERRKKTSGSWMDDSHVPISVAIFYPIPTPKASNSPSTGRKTNFKALDSPAMVFRVAQPGHQVRWLDMAFFDKKRVGAKHCLVLSPH